LEGRELYCPQPLRRRGLPDHLPVRPRHPRPPRGRYWVVDEKTFKAWDADNRIWWGKDSNNAPAIKRFLSEVADGRTPQTLWFYKEVGHTQDAKKTLLKYVPFAHTENVLNSVKPVELIQRMLQLATEPDEEAIVLDFFSGSAATAHAVLAQNRADGGNRRFIGVQVAEPLPKPEPGMASIFDMGLTRIRNVIAELSEQTPDTAEADADPESADPAADPPAAAPGFRVLKIDSTNMQDVYYRPDQLRQADLLGLVDNIKPDRGAEDLLFQVLLDWGVDLTLPIARETLAGRAVFFVDTDALAACFAPDIDEALVRAIAARRPLRAVFRDAGFSDDSLKINVEQLFRALSPGTEVRAI